MEASAQLPGAAGPRVTRAHRPLHGATRGRHGRGRRGPVPRGGDADGVQLADRHGCAARDGGRPRGHGVLRAPARVPAGVPAAPADRAWWPGRARRVHGHAVAGAHVARGHRQAGGRGPAGAAGGAHALPRQAADGTHHGSVRQSAPRNRATDAGRDGPHVCATRKPRPVRVAHLRVQEPRSDRAARFA